MNEQDSKDALDFAMSEEEQKDKDLIDTPIESSFEKLAKINVNEHAEKKGRFTYLSWAWAVDVLKRNEPSATWEIIRFDGLPYLKTDLGFFVEVAVTVQGTTLSQLHPVLDNYNKPITKPNSFQINTSIQRALVKAIALHGLGLYIYAGEDLPEVKEDKDKSDKEKLAESADEDMKEVKEKGANMYFSELKKELEACGSYSEIEGVCERDKAKISKLRNHHTELFKKVEECKEAMKGIFNA
jgi:hypothetical protein